MFNYVAFNCRNPHINEQTYYRHGGRIWAVMQGSIKRSAKQAKNPHTNTGIIQLTADEVKSGDNQENQKEFNTYYV